MSAGEAGRHVVGVLDLFVDIFLAILLRALAKGHQYWLVQCGGRDIRRAFGWLWSPESCTAGWEQDLLESSFAQALAFTLVLLARCRWHRYGEW